MKIYADSSAMLAWFHPADPFAKTVTDWCRDKQPEFCWNMFLRAEIRHNLRRLTGKYAAIAWHSYRSSETGKRLRMDLPSAADYFEWADDLSARHGAASRAGTWDCLHVAAAQRLRADVFITCDIAQAELAKAIGLVKVRLFH